MWSTEGSGGCRDPNQEGGGASYPVYCPLSILALKALSTAVAVHTVGGRRCTL